MDTAQPTGGGSTGGLGRLAWRVVYRQQPLRMGKPTGLVVAHCCRGVEPVVGIPTHLTAHVQNHAGHEVDGTTTAAGKRTGERHIHFVERHHN